MTQIMKTLKELFQYIATFFIERCKYCGGKLEEYSWKKTYCEECGRENH